MDDAGAAIGNSLTTIAYEKNIMVKTIFIRINSFSGYQLKGN